MLVLLAPEVTARVLHVEDCKLLDRGKVERSLELNVARELRPDAVIRVSCDNAALEITIDDPETIARRTVQTPTAAIDRTTATIIGEMLRTPFIEPEPAAPVEFNVDAFAAVASRYSSELLGLGLSFGATIFANHRFFLEPSLNLLTGRSKFELVDVRHTEFTGQLLVGVQHQIDDIQLRLGLGARAGLLRLVPTFNQTSDGVLRDADYVFRSLDAGASVKWRTTRRVSLVGQVDGGWLPSALTARVEPSDTTITIEGLWVGARVGIAFRL